MADFRRNCDKCTVDLQFTDEALAECITGGGGSGIVGPLIGGAVGAIILCAVTGVCNFRKAE